MIEQNIGYLSQLQLRQGQVILVAVTIFVFCLYGKVFAHSEFHGGEVQDHRPVKTEFGQFSPDFPPVRTLRVLMTDGMRFYPDSFTVMKGETVRIIVSNAGDELHEFVLGISETFQRHQNVPLELESIAHEEPYMIHVKPGSTGSIIWRFSISGTVRFACLIPGHFEAGMVGVVNVEP